MAGCPAGERAEQADWMVSHNQKPHLPLAAADLADALRITWCIEAPWWIREEIRTGGSPKVRRFLDEILWVGKNWDALDALVRQ